MGGWQTQESFIVDNNFIVLMKKTVAIYLNYLNEG